MEKGKLLIILDGNIIKGDNNITITEKNTIIMDRYNRLSNSVKNVKAPGVVKKLRRKLRKAGMLG